jgi:hypothetical protein
VVGGNVPRPGARAHGSLTFPANFQLVAAMNPCPGGFFGDPNRACTRSTTMQLQLRRDRPDEDRAIAGGVLVRAEAAAH